MKLGILADLHLGYAEATVWHNRQLHAHAEEIVRAAVASLNCLWVDRVIVLGDLTQAGRESEMRTAYALLSELAAPWWVMPGNHDREGVASGAFDQIFRAHLPALYERVPEAGLLFVRERWPPVGEGPAMRLDWRGLDSAIQAAASTAPATPLLVSTHFPLLGAEYHAAVQQARYAGHFADGEVLVDRLCDARRGPIVLLCAHQHWHHVMRVRRGHVSPSLPLCPGEPSAAAARDVLQCSTASLIEYPMECRIVTLEAGALTGYTLPTASPDLARRSLLGGAIWVRGDAEARAFTVPRL